MTNSQIPNNVNHPKRTKVVFWLIACLTIGMILATLILFNHKLLPETYPHPTESEGSQSSYEFTSEYPPTEPDYSYTPMYFPGDFEAELEKSRAKWENADITHYQMSVYLPYSSDGIGNLSMPMTVEVKDGNVVSVLDAQGTTVSPDNPDALYYYQNFFTVSGLFTFAYQVYLEKPPLLRVTYDPTLGYPDSIQVNPYMEPCCDDYMITIESLQRLSP